jgi:hypothetical protein
MTTRAPVSHPLRIHWTRFDGLPLPAGAVLVTRRSRGGNPFRVEDYGRGEAIRLFEAWLPRQADLMAQLPNLRGRQLACDCRLDEPCHADVLARLASGKEMSQ